MVVLATACGDDRGSDADEHADTGDGGAATTWACQHDGASEIPDYLAQLGCRDDFELLASQPADANLPGARSVKTVIDRDDGDRLYFQHSERYPIHHDFAFNNLSVADGFAPVADLSGFNREQYSLPERRFLLGALTHYEGPDVWAYEIAPYDRASAEMIALSFDAIRDNSYLGDRLVFHPTSEDVRNTAADLPADIPIVTTDDLYDGIDYQALNVAESYGRLRFIGAGELNTSFLSFRDIVVIDSVPNDISVALGIITSEFQTPLAHINVLSQNRGTPNMALRDAFNRQELRALEGEWVRLEVGAFGYTLEAVTMAEADAWWEDNRPSEVQVPGADLSVTDLRDIAGVVTYDESASGEDKLAAIKQGTRAFGGKAANFSALARIEGVHVPAAFAIPVYYYFQFMRENAFDERVEEMLADPAFRDDPEVRDRELTRLQDAMRTAPVNADFERMLLDKLAADYPVGLRLRFRSSTNAEDLDGFTGAGLYTSKSGDPNDPAYPVLNAVRRVWASVWFFRAFEERSYRSIDHQAVGMALLVHRSFPEEEANGVALTDNPYDRSGIEPAFYVNVQYGDNSVVMPDVGVTTDQFLYYYAQADRPTMYLSHSSLGADGDTVLSRAQVHELGEALTQVRSYFSPIYGSRDWWAMDVEFKFDGEPGEEPQLFVKQARPFGDR